MYTCVCCTRRTGEAECVHENAAAASDSATNVRQRLSHEQGLGVGAYTRRQFNKWTTCATGVHGRTIARDSRLIWIYMACACSRTLGDVRYCHVPLYCNDNRDAEYHASILRALTRTKHCFSWIRHIQEAIDVSMSLIDLTQKSACGRDCVAYEQEDSLVSRKLYSFTNDVNKLSHRQVRWTQVFLFVEVRKVALVVYSLTDDSHAIRILFTDAPWFLDSLVERVHLAKRSGCRHRDEMRKQEGMTNRRVHKCFYLTINESVCCSFVVFHSLSLFS